MFILVVLSYALIGFYEITPLVKNKQKKELLLFSIIFALAFLLSLLLSLDIEIPSPAEPIEAVVDYILGR